MKGRELILCAAAAALAFLPGASWTQRGIAAGTAFVVGLASVRLWGPRGSAAALAVALALPVHATPQLLWTTGAVGVAVVAPTWAWLAVPLAGLSAPPALPLGVATAGLATWTALVSLTRPSATPESSWVTGLPRLLVWGTALGLLGVAIAASVLEASLALTLAACAVVFGGLGAGVVAAVAWRTGETGRYRLALASLALAAAPLGVVLDWPVRDGLAVAAVGLAVHAPVAVDLVTRRLPVWLRAALLVVVAAAWGLIIRLAAP